MEIVGSKRTNKEEHAASERTSRAGKWSREEHQCGAYAVSSSANDLAYFAARTPPLNPAKPSQRGGEHDTYSKSDYGAGD